jgi:hypothetical protein
MAVGRTRSHSGDGWNDPRPLTYAGPKPLTYMRDTLAHYLFRTEDSPVSLLSHDRRFDELLVATPK